MIINKKIKKLNFNTLLIVFIFLLFLIFCNTGEIIYGDNLLVIPNAGKGQFQDLFTNIGKIPDVSLFNKNSPQYFIIMDHLLDLNYIKKFFNNNYILILYADINIGNSLVLILFDNINNRILYSTKLYYVDIEFLKTYLYIYVENLTKILKIYKKNKFDDLFLFTISANTIKDNDREYYVTYKTKDIDFTKILILNVLLQQLQKKGFYLNISKTFFQKNFNKKQFLNSLLKIVNFLIPYYSKIIRSKNIIFYLYPEELFNTKIVDILKNKNLDNNTKFIVSYLIME